MNTERRYKIVCQNETEGDLVTLVENEGQIFNFLFNKLDTYDEIRVYDVLEAPHKLTMHVLNGEFQEVDIKHRPATNSLATWEETMQLLNKLVTIHPSRKNQDPVELLYQAICGDDLTKPDIFEVGKGNKLNL